MRVRTWRRVMVAATVTAVAVTSSPAWAAARPATQLTVRATPATSLVRSTVTVSGTVSPAGKATPVVLQRLVGKAWVTMTSQKPLLGKAFTFHVRAPKKAGAWTLRVVRAGSTSTRAGVSGTLHLRSVSTAYTVSTTVTPGTSLQVSGAVKPKAKGSVQLQLLTGKVWHTAGSAKLTARSTYAFDVAKPAGSYRVRVVKAFSSAVAAGTGRAVTAVVTGPETPVTITTVNLPAARVGVPYTATLVATGGSGALSWMATGLPGGLTLSAAGVISGMPTTRSNASLLVSASDRSGHHASATLPLTVSPRAGQAYAWGLNASGELGNGTTADSSNRPLPVSGMSSVIALASGSFTGYALKADGTVWAWGRNTEGELGNGTTTSTVAPVQVSGLSAVTGIAGSSLDGYALEADGTVWSWGRNADGELGNGTTTDSSVPVQVANLTGVTAISGAGDDGYALRSDGTVWAWGDNTDGQLGNGAVTASSMVPTQVTGLLDATSVSAGDGGAYALRATGQVVAWGYGGDGELGDSSTADSRVPMTVLSLSSAVTVSAGYASGYALLRDGTVRSWGYNHDGQLGNGGTTDSSVPVQVTGLTGVVSVGGGGVGGYAILGDGTMRSWGVNDDGELGDGTNTSSTTPVKVSGVSSAFAIAQEPEPLACYVIAAS